MKIAQIEADQYISELSVAVAETATKIMNSGAINPDTFSKADALRIATYLVADRQLSKADKNEIKNIECFV